MACGLRKRLRVHVSGAAEPDISIELEALEGGQSLVLGQDWQGRLDEVVVFDRALSADQLELLYKVR